MKEVVGQNKIKKYCRTFVRTGDRIIVDTDKYIGKVGCATILNVLD